MNKLTLFAAVSVLTGAFVAQAQTTTPVLTVAVKLVDNTPNDGKIILSSNRNSIFRKGNAINSEPCPVTALTPAFSYTKFGVACPVASVPTPTPTPEPSPTPTPTPTPTVPVQELVALGADVFIREGGISVGIGPDGGLGSSVIAPAGWANVRPNYKRIALAHTGKNIDPVITGAGVEGFVIKFTRDGVRERLSNLVGRLELPVGSIGSDGTWTGEAKGLRVVQRPIVTADGVRFNITLTNTGATPIGDLRYLREVDFTDHDRVFSTANKIVGPASIEAVLRGTSKATAYIRTDDPRFAPSVFGFVNEDPDAIAPLPVGYSITANLTANLVGALGGLEVGESTSFVIELGVR